MIQFPSIAQYLFESSFCLTAFYLLFHLAYKKHTFFQFNRFYLLGTALASLCFPLLSISLVNDISNPPLALSKVVPVVESYNIMYAHMIDSVEQPLLWQISVGDLIASIYKLGVFLFGLKLLSSLFKIYDIIKASKGERTKECTLLNTTDESVLASSFFSYIFWNDAKDEKSKIIIDHELVHVKQWHSIDVILMEFMVVLKWFNPLIYLFRNNLRRTHEYIADRYVSSQIGNKYKYAQFIVNENRNESVALTNKMFSFIKDRLIMLNQKETARWKRLKCLWVMPLTFSLFMLFSFDMSDRLPDEIVSPIKQIENKIINFSNKSLISFQDESGWQKQFIWGSSVRINLDAEVLEQEIFLNVSNFKMGEFFSELPTVSNLNKELHFYPVYHNTADETYSFSITDFLDETRRDSILNNFNRNDNFTFISEFIDNGKIYKQYVTLSFENSFFGNRSYQPNHQFKWGDIDLNFAEKDSNSVYTSFRQSDVILLNSWSTEVTLSNYNRFFPNVVSSFPILDISFEAYSSQLENKVMIVTKDDVPKTLLPTQEVEIRITRKFFQRLKSLDIESINDYRASMNLPDAVRLNPYADTYGNHEVEQYLKTTVSKLKNSKEIRDWLLKVGSGDFVEFKFLESDSNASYGLTFVIEDANKIEYPDKITAPIKSKEFIDFQIFINRNGKSYVRLDTTLLNNKKIIDSYKNSSSYEIVHVPNFKTKVRVVDRDLKVSEFMVMAEMKAEIQNINPYALHEYYPESELDLRLLWGKMLSMKRVGNFSFKEFERSYTEELNLKFKDDDLEILMYDMIIPIGSGIYKRVRTDSNAYFKIQEMLGKVEPISTIYIDNIIVNKDDQKLLLPYQFSYSFE